MRKVLRRLVALVALSLLGCAGPRAESTGGASPPALMVWRVRHPEHPGVRLDLVGTIHVGRADGRFDRALERAVTEATEVLVEIDLGPAELKQLEALVKTRARLPSGETLRSKLRPETFTRLETQAARLKVPMAALDQLQPWAVVLFLQQLSLAQTDAAGDGASAQFGLDQQIMELAREGGAPIRSMETVESQLALFAFDDPVRAESEMQSLLDGLEHPERRHVLLDAHLRGDTAALARVVDTAEAKSEAGDRMWRQRNETMFEALRDGLQGGRSRLAALGAGHVVGSDGLLARFEGAGFQVERLVAQGPGREFRIPWHRELANEVEAAFPVVPKTSQGGTPKVPTNVRLARTDDGEWILETLDLPPGTRVAPEAVHAAALQAACRGRTVGPTETSAVDGIRAAQTRCSGGSPEAVIDLRTSQRGSQVRMQQVATKGLERSDRLELDARRFLRSLRVPSSPR